MWRSVSTEAAGWREALSDRRTVLAVLLRLLSAALLAVIVLAVAGTIGVWQAVLAPPLVALGYSLAMLRATGSP